jgi:hypothetical protein
MRYLGGFITASYNPLKVPNPPTIGTATSSTITFTAPSNIGGSAITAYFAVATDTSSGAQFTGTASSSPITVSGLTAGNTYTYRVYAVNSYGPSAYSGVSNSTIAEPNIGDAYEGGYFAGYISTAGNGIADYRLVIAPKASGESGDIQWKTTATSTTGTSSVIDGPTNSSNMNNATHPAAQFCEGLSIGGYTDWYSPAKNELEVCYFNLKPTTTSNDTNSGTNANAVPARASNYTTGNPTQTTAVIFRSGGAEAFNSGTGDYYWSSTQETASNAWTQLTRNGDQTGRSKTSIGEITRVRAVRRVAI